MCNARAQHPDLLWKWRQIWRLDTAQFLSQRRDKRNFSPACSSYTSSGQHRNVTTAASMMKNATRLETPTPTYVSFWIRFSCRCACSGAFSLGGALLLHFLGGLPEEQIGADRGPELSHYRDCASRLERDRRNNGLVCHGSPG